MSNLQDARDGAVDNDAEYHDAPTPMTAQERKVILASSLGTISPARGITCLRIGQFGSCRSIRLKK